MMVLHWDIQSLSMMLVQNSNVVLPSAKPASPRTTRVPHLAVSDRNARFGHELCHRGAPSVDALDAVVHEVDLTIAVELAQDRLAHQRLVEVATNVLTGRRSSGGVSILLRSRTPVRLMYRVRGWASLVRVSTSTRCEAA